MFFHVGMKDLFARALKKSLKYSNPGDGDPSEKILNLEKPITRVETFQAEHLADSATATRCSRDQVQIHVVRLVQIKARLSSTPRRHLHSQTNQR